nr:metalloendoproteinase 2-MMP-like [Quercus suber]
MVKEQYLGESQKGQRVQGLREVKHYLNKFGYLNYKDSNNFEDDEFDEALEVAIKTYQTHFHLKVTGKLDTNTIKQMSIPRCGVPDIINRSLTQPQFEFFPGNPRWPFYKRNLEYAFQSSAPPNIKLKMPIDLVLGFHRVDHGDGQPFDGLGGFFAHAFPPTNGRLHYDADEIWSNSLDLLPYQTDLKAVSLHGIGHLLGLGHSAFEPSTMYPAIRVGKTKRGLSSDDMDGLLTLYSRS